MMCINAENCLSISIDEHFALKSLKSQAACVASHSNFAYDTGCNRGWHTVLLGNLMLKLSDQQQLLVMLIKAEHFLSIDTDDLLDR